MYPVRRFCLSNEEAITASLRTGSLYRLCGIQVRIRDSRPMDYVILRSCSTPNCSSRFLSCGTQVFFSGLFPGEYSLVIGRQTERMGVALRLPPGCNVVVYTSFVEKRCVWHRDPFHYFYNAT